MAKREMLLQLVITVPATTPERDVEFAINAALDEPPCDWRDWNVGYASIKDVVRIEDD